MIEAASVGHVSLELRLHGIDVLAHFGGMLKQSSDSRLDMLGSFSELIYGHRSVGSKHNEISNRERVASNEAGA